MFILSIGTSLFEVLPLCFRKGHYFKKMLDFSIHLLIPAEGQFVTIKTSQDEFSLGKTLFHPETTYFTHKEDFPGKVQIPKWAPFAPNVTANQIAGKSWNHRGQYWTFKPHGPKTLDIAPKCGINDNTHHRQIAKLESYGEA